MSKCLRPTTDGPAFFSQPMLTIMALAKSCWRQPKENCTCDSSNWGRSLSDTQVLLTTILKCPAINLPKLISVSVTTLRGQWMPRWQISITTSLTSLSSILQLWPDTSWLSYDLQPLTLGNWPWVHLFSYSKCLPDNIWSSLTSFLALIPGLTSVPWRVLHCLVFMTEWGGHSLFQGL